MLYKPCNLFEPIIDDDDDDVIDFCSADRAVQQG